MEDITTNDTQLGGAKKHIENNLKNLQQMKDELQSGIQSHQEVIELLETLPQKVYHDIIVPFGSQAFFLGQLIHTHEVYMGLGCKNFALRTSTNASLSLYQRVKFFETKQKELEDQILDIKNNLKLVNEFHDDDHGLVKTDIQKSEDSDLNLNVGSSVRKTSEGFLEIREQYESDSDTEPERFHQEFNQSTFSQPLGSSLQFPIGDTIPHLENVYKVAHQSTEKFQKDLEISNINNTKVSNTKSRFMQSRKS